MEEPIKRIIDNVKRVIIGKDEIIQQILICLLSEGHILLEGAPGLGKTRLAVALARSVEGDYKRIQFTPDVLPSDVTGFYVYNKELGDFEYKDGAVRCNFLLADEINRASPRVQSSLLEAMEERQVTVEGVTKTLPNPFMVIATQNTIEHQGTYPLPEAQMDRFFMKLHLDHPSRKEWEEILQQSEGRDPLKSLEQVVNLEELEKVKKKLEQVVVSKEVKAYLLDLTEAISRHELVELGISPRGTIALLKATRGAAIVEGRSYAVPDDVQRVLKTVVGHRLVLKATAKWKSSEVDDILKEALEQVTPPVFNV